VGGNRKRSYRKEQEDDKDRNIRMRWAGTGRDQIQRSRKMSGYEYRDDVGRTKTFL
jgi:hypothetical protein